MASRGLAISRGGSASGATEHPLVVRLWGGPKDRYWRAEANCQSDQGEQVAPFIESVAAAIQTPDGKINPVSPLLSCFLYFFPWMIS